MTKEEKEIAKKKREDYGNNVTEFEFKENLRQAMYDDIKYTPCLVHCVDEVMVITSQAQPVNGCNICIEGHKKFLEDEDAWLEGRWQDALERRNVIPCSDEEMDAIFAEQGLVLDRKTRRFELINK